MGGGTTQADHTPRCEGHEREALQGGFVVDGNHRAELGERLPDLLVCKEDADPVCTIPTKEHTTFFGLKRPSFPKLKHDYKFT